MRITSDTRTSFVELERVEAELDRFPSICFAVQVEDKGFRGENSRVWFAQSMCGEFVKGLAGLEKLRQGLATFESISPGECAIHVKSLDRAGHLAVYYELMRRGLLGSTSSDWSVHGAFLVDPSSLAGFSRDFKEAVLIRDR